MIEFPDSFFDREIREGFEIVPMIKKAWAGQMEVMQAIRKVCENHNIKWFADYGTLLGAIRHKGFIPWDDDMDIGMTRDNLNKFIKYAPSELPEGYKVICMDLEPKYDSLIVRVVNSTSISMSEKRMHDFHGCPYVLGLDIFPLDYLSRNEDERKLHIELINIILAPRESLIKECSKEEQEEYIQQIEMLTGQKIDRKMPLNRALLSLVEKLMGIFGPEDADEVTGIWRITYQKNFHFPKEWFNDLVEVPFENITVPVPRMAREILKIKYGEKYMEPKIDAGHDYPFYKDQERTLAEKIGYILE